MQTQELSTRPRGKLKDWGRRCSLQCLYVTTPGSPPWPADRQAPDRQPGPLTRLARADRFHRGGGRWDGPTPAPCPLARKAACSPCGYRDLIVLPRREETGELSSECILELAEKNIWERKLTSETNIPLYQLFF